MSLRQYLETRATRDIDAEFEPYRQRGPRTSPLCAPCSCVDRPRCNCGNDAVGSVRVWADWFPRIAFTWEFICKPCWEYYSRESRKPIPGWTRPEWADAEWKPSIDAVVDLALMKMNEEARRAHERKMRESLDDIDAMECPMIFQKGANYTPEQLKQLAILRRMKRASAA